MLRRAIMPGLLVLALAIIVVQGRRILTLEASFDQGSQTAGLAPVTIVPAFEASDLSGVRVTVAYNAALDPRPTVLYVFSPSCVWRARNSSAVAQLSSQLSIRYRVMGLSLDSENLAQYVGEHHLTFPVYTNAPDSAIAAYRLGPTPSTIVIAPSGTVVKTWVGAYTGSVKGSVESFFSVRLPGLS